jgi:hypothetical protein
LECPVLQTGQSLLIGCAQHGRTTCLFQLPISTGFNQHTCYTSIHHLHLSSVDLHLIAQSARKARPVLSGDHPDLLRGARSYPAPAFAPDSGPSDWPRPDQDNTRLQISVARPGWPPGRKNKECMHAACLSGGGRGAWRRSLFNDDAMRGPSGSSRLRFSNSGTCSEREPCTSPSQTTPTIA